MAIVKLANVPINTYSVVLISLLLFNSPNRKIDFAASKKPIISILPISTKVKIKTRSRYPIHFPAFCKLRDTVLLTRHQIPQYYDLDKNL